MYWIKHMNNSLVIEVSDRVSVVANLVSGSVSVFVYGEERARYDDASVKTIPSALMQAESLDKDLI